MKNKFKKMYGIIFLLSMFFVIPNVSASIETSDLSYKNSGQDVEVKYSAGAGDAVDNFVYPTKFSYSSTDYAFIDKYLLEQSGNKLSLNLDFFKYRGEEIKASDSAEWNITVKFNTNQIDEETGEYVGYTVYEGLTTIEELTKGKTILLDLSDVQMNKYYRIDFEVTLVDGDEEMETFGACTNDGYDTNCLQYSDFFIGSSYGIEFESKIDDTYGTSKNGSYIELGGFFDDFDSFSYSLKLTNKEKDATYNLKMAYCTYADSDSFQASSSDTCEEKDVVEDARLNVKYFNTVVDKELYDSELAAVDYIKFSVYNGISRVVDKIYYLEHEEDAQTEFATYTITDKTGHDVLSDNISNSKTVTIKLKGINFREDEKYYVQFYVTPKVYDEGMYDKSFKPYTGKQLNEGISVDVKFENLKDVIAMAIYSNCAYNCEAPECQVEDVYELWMEHYTEQITITDISKEFDEFKVEDLTAKGTDYNTVELTFTALNGATGYQIYRSTSESSGYKLLGTTETEKYVDKKASLKTKYYYKVRAYNEDTGSRIYSKYSTVKSAKAKLHTPENVTAKSYNYNSVTISYDAVNGATGYAIYRSTSKNGTYKLVDTTTSTSYRDKSLTTGKTYYYKVKAYRTISSKKYYSSYSTYTSAKPVVGTPIIKATGYDYNINKITITKKPAGTTGYAIYRMNPTSSDQKYEFLARTTNSYYYDKGVETGKVYYYKVRAYRTVDGTRKYGDYSKEALSAGVVQEVDFTIDNSSSRSSLTINITKTDGATGYYIYRDSEKIATVTDLEYTDEDVEYGESYSYKVTGYRTVNGEEVIGVSGKEVTATVKPATPELKITNVSYTKQRVNLSSDEIDEDDEYTYRLYRSTSATKGFALVYEGSESSVEIPSLSFNKTYYYYATIELNGVKSNKGDVVSKKTALTKVSASAKYASKTSIKISWSKVTGATGYQVYRATSKTGTYKLIKTTTSTSYKDTSLTTGKTYYYKVRAYRTVDGKKVYGSFSTVVNDKPRVGVPKFSLTSSSATSNKITITEVSGASGYVIYRSESFDGPYTRIVTTTKTTYTDKKVEEGKTYYYKVIAYSLVGSTKKYGDVSEPKTLSQVE